MGVPKFFRWLSERYPKINQRFGSLPDEETCLRHFDKLPPPPVLPPDPLSTCGLPPPIDRLYIDMNGVIHGCSHNNTALEEPISRQEIFQNVAYYLDRVIGDIAQPSQLVYLSIDGVAPRAKLNQQRSRRYRSGNEGEIETTIYEAHLLQQHKDEKTHSTSSTLPGFEEAQQASASNRSSGPESLKEVEPGRFTGKFESHAVEADEGSPENSFHHNEITPGTPFFQECTNFLQPYIEQKVANDPKWQHLTIIFSGPNVPGEGEHKIMDFIRRERTRPDYDPNITHCIMGQDGDWIMLGLASHEPNLVLLRERVVFDAKQQALLEKDGISSYIHNGNFEFLHMSILRDYLAFEFETREVVPSSKFELESTIDDFVFLTFFVGNDFLPHMPALDIADEAFDLLFQTYRNQRKQWQRKKKKMHPYLTHEGSIVSGQRLESFLQQLGQHEVVYHDNKKRQQPTEFARQRKSDLKHGREPTIPEEEVLESKEEADRQRYREMLTVEVSQKADEQFSPVLTKDNIVKSTDFEPAPEDDQEGLVTRMSNLLQFSVPSSQNEDGSVVVLADDQDLKGRYYYDKFGFTPFDAQKHIALRKAYIEGLVWNLKYYYQGCVSWDWYYPYHYGPMLSDLVGIDDMLEEIRFDDLGEPLRPFEQLMGCMPPSSAHLLPEPYQWLLTDTTSPLADFYPRTFTVDMNGKRWPWEAVVLLPFIDAKRLTDAARRMVKEDLLSEEEKKRNENGNAWVIVRDEKSRASQIVPLESTEWDYHPGETAVLKPELMAGVRHPRAGFPTLKEAPVRSLWRRAVGINVFGMRSRYRTALLVVGEVLPTTPPIEMLGKTLVGTTIYINYPYLTEAFVTAVSNSESTMRGVDDVSLRRWDAAESTLFQQKTSAMKRNQAFGEKISGSGGWMMPDHDITVSVRPLKEIQTLPDGTKARIFAKFEVDVPLTAAVWAPSYQDSRVAGVPALMEKDPYHVTADNGEEMGTSSTSTALLPEYEEPESELPTQLGPMLPHLPESDPYSSPLILPSFEDQDPPVMHHPHEEETSIDSNKAPPIVNPERHSTQLLPPEDDESSTSLLPSHEDTPPEGKDSSKRHSTQLLPPEDDESSASLLSPQEDTPPEDKDSSKSLLPPPEDVAPILSRGFTSSARNMRNPILRPNSSKRSFTSSAGRVARTKQVTGGNPRFRLLALGAAAAAVALSGSGAHAFDGIIPSQPLIDVRGGDQLSNAWHESATERKSLLDDVSPPPLEFAHGTTTLSFIFDGGIVAAVDSRASLGNFVGSKTTQKVLPISSHMLGTMAGGAADCMFWIRKIKAEAQYHELAEGRRMSVARASKLLASSLYQSRGLDLSVGTMIMGFDESNGPQIYYVDNTGARIHGDLFAVGSGSTFAYAILDTERRKEMTEDEAIALGIKAIRHATFRDAFSGGFINVYVINKQGWRKVFSEDLARSPSDADVIVRKDRVE